MPANRPIAIYFCNVNEDCENSPEYKALEDSKFRSLFRFNSLTNEVLSVCLNTNKLLSHVASLVLGRYPRALENAFYENQFFDDTVYETYTM